MKQKRNIDKYTTAADARLNLLRAMARWHMAYPLSRACKSSMGYAAFPTYDFKRPQGAAFAVAKIVKDMERAGEVRYTSDGLHWGHVITSVGLEAVK